MDMANSTEFVPKSEDLSKLSSEAQALEGLSEIKSISSCVLKKSECKPGRSEISDFGDEGFLLHGLLSHEESKFYIDEGEKIGFHDIKGAKKSYRCSQRIILNDEELANQLWKRISPFLKDITITGDPHSFYIHGVESILQGTWKPSKLNQLFRLCRYYPGGHFGPHFDGHYITSTRERSMKTLMIYLNGDFIGGSTNFVDDKQELYQDEDGKYVAQAQNVLCKVQPEEGMAIIFNHHRLHEGETLRSGVKYILRTDIMYTKCTNTDIDPVEEQAFQMVQDAERLEGLGENMKAMELYRKAFKLSPSLEAAYGN